MDDAASVNSPLKRNAGVALATLVASTGTLVCCVLPAVMVALGVGATLAGIVSAVPQLVWLSGHKPWVFGLAFALLLVSGVLVWRARLLPCPVEPSLSRTCRRLRRVSIVLWSVALAVTTVGAMFAFVLPRI